MKTIQELKERGILKEITNESKINDLPKGSGIYVGFDPTAESLHLGNYIQIANLKRFQKDGFKVIALLGGATGMIGDPSGKSEERNLLSEEQLNKNKSKIKSQLESFGLEVVDNLDFYKDMNILEFLRDAGKLLNVNYMINKDVVKSRLENGISFTEFSYQLIQGWDFKKLYEEHNIMIQMGGSDQWGNITSGIEMIRKTLGDKNHALGITANLLTDSHGNKFGKSTNGAIWLSKDMCSPYKLYQYLLNTSDSDVEKLLLWLSFDDIEDIKKIIKKHKEDPSKRFAQKALARTLINDIHSQKDFEKAEEISNALFSNSNFSLSEKDYEQLVGSIPMTETNTSDIEELLVESRISKSKRESRELLEKGSISINGALATLNTELKNKRFSLIRKGKKHYFLIKHK